MVKFYFIKSIKLFGRIPLTACKRLKLHFHQRFLSYINGKLFVVSQASDGSYIYMKENIFENMCYRKNGTMKPSMQLVPLNNFYRDFLDIVGFPFLLTIGCNFMGTFAALRYEAANYQQLVQDDLILAIHELKKNVFHYIISFIAIWSLALTNFNNI